MILVSSLISCTPRDPLILSYHPSSYHSSILYLYHPSIVRYHDPMCRPWSRVVRDLLYTTWSFASYLIILRTNMSSIILRIIMTLLIVLSSETLESLYLIFDSSSLRSILHFVDTYLPNSLFFIQIASKPLKSPFYGNILYELLSK